MLPIRSRTAPAAALVALMVVTGCSGTGATLSAADLEGATFESVSVSGRALVPGSTIRLVFADQRLAVHAGCNTISSSWTVTGGVVKWTGQPASTLIGCPAELAAQDAWLTSAFTQGMTGTRDGTKVSLSGGGTTIVLERRS